MAAPAVIAAAAKSRIGRYLVMTLISVIVLPLIGLISAVGAVFVIVATAVTGSSQNTGALCSAEFDDAAEIQIPGADGDGMWTLTNEEREVAIGLYAGASAAEATDEELALVLGAAMQESHLQIYANPIVPESMDLPHHQEATPVTSSGEAVDPIGPLQQRPSAGWGDVATLMDPSGAAQAFIGGEDGPNAGSPAGLRDIPGIESMDFADAIEAVQYSGEPEHYARWESSALYLVELLRDGAVVTCGSITGEATYPLQDWDKVTVSSPLGPRSSPAAGASSWHPAYDLIYSDRSSCGQPVLAAIPGVVIVAGNYNDGLGNRFWIQSQDGASVGYYHMEVQHVQVGDTVEAGQQIGEVGSAPPSTGCHLDIRVDASAAIDPAVQALPQLREATVCPTCVDPNEYFKLYGLTLFE